MKFNINNSLGFTLIELLVVVVIVGVLALAAVPAYDGYIKNTNKSLAEQVLAQNAAIMEKNYSQIGSYSNSDKTWPTNIIKEVDGSSGKVYSIDFAQKIPASTNEQSYFLEASPESNSAQANTGYICIDQNGNISQYSSPSCGMWSSRANLCSGGTPSGGAMAVCANSDNCSNSTICGSCSAGNGADGSCSNSYIGGACTGDCTNAYIVGDCSGDCTGSTVLGRCTGTGC